MGLAECCTLTRYLIWWNKAVGCCSISQETFIPHFFLPPQLETAYIVLILSCPWLFALDMGQDSLCNRAFHSCSSLIAGWNIGRIMCIIFWLRYYPRYCALVGSLMVHWRPCNALIPSPSLNCLVANEQLKHSKDILQCFSFMQHFCWNVYRLELKIWSSFLPCSDFVKNSIQI